MRSKARSSVRDAAPYTYLRLKTANGEMWAAIPQTSVPNGAQVTIEDALLMKDFESRTLNRKFDRIALGTLAGAKAVGTPAAPANPHAGLATNSDVPDVKVAKASGADARTVADIVASRASLKDRNVLVRGKVVKFTPGVMGRNWIHLRDGSGSASDRTNDVLVTTSDESKVGDIVTVKGIVRIDKDFGAGYAYPVVIEEARLAR